MPGRHIAPRHKAPRSLGRALGRLAADAVGAVPTSGVSAVAVLVGAAGVAAGIGVVTLGAEANTTETAASVTAPTTSADSDGSAPTRADDADASARVSTADKEQVSRSASRPALFSVQRATKNQALTVSHQGVTGRVTESVAPTDPRDMAMLMLADYGWSDQFSCLDQLYLGESNWNPSAMNPSSGAYGIPQSLPGEKMATAGADWRTNPATQLEWGLDYIQSRYGSPCSAWYFKEYHNWY